MNIFLMLQGVMLLVVLNVLVSRFARRHSAAHHEMLGADEVAIRTTGQKIGEAQHHENVALQKIEALKENIAQTERQLEAAEKELDAVRKAPPDLYYIFDRLEPKQGIIWEVQVSRNPDVPVSARVAAVWRQPRRYLITAKTPREAMERAGQRFFDKTGLTIENVVSCPLFMTKRGAAAATAAASQQQDATVSSGVLATMD